MSPRKHPGVFVIQKDGSLSALLPAEFTTEDDFQKLLAKHPDLIPGNQVDPTSPRRWILVTRELGIATEQEGGDRIWLDHLFLDQDGVPTLIEVKRKSDTRARREVVAQMLDYAANASAFLPVQKIRDIFERAHSDPGKVLLESLGWTHSMDEFWKAVKTNLEAGRLRLVFVADRIPPELQRIVEFLNRQTDPMEILAVEIPRYEGQGIQALVPRVLGQSVTALDHKIASTSEKIRWDWESFSKKLASAGQGAVRVAQEILSWAKQNGVGVDWMENKEGSFILSFPGKQKPFYPVRITSSGDVGWNAPHQGDYSPPPFENLQNRKEILSKLQNVLGARADLDRPNGFSALELTLQSLEKPEALQAFLAVMTWIKSMLKKAQ